MCRLHEFVWHGTDPNNKTRKVPGGLKFTKLRVIPDQFYLNIDDVSTHKHTTVDGSDNVCLCVRFAQRTMH